VWSRTSLSHRAPTESPNLNTRGSKNGDVTLNTFVLSARKRIHPCKAKQQPVCARRGRGRMRPPSWATNICIGNCKPCASTRTFSLKLSLARTCIVQKLGTGFSFRHLQRYHGANGLTASHHPACGCDNYVWSRTSLSHRAPTEAPNLNTHGPENGEVSLTSHTTLAELFNGNTTLTRIQDAPRNLPSIPLVLPNTIVETGDTFKFHTFFPTRTTLYSSRPALSMDHGSCDTEIEQGCSPRRRTPRAGVRRASSRERRRMGLRAQKSWPLVTPLLPPFETTEIKLALTARCRPRKR
jgi:hypothetical protein